MPVNEGFLDLERCKLHYEADGTGEAVVFLHGFSLDLRAWDGQFEHFAGSYRAVRYDLRGFGHSSLPKENAPYSHVEDLRTLLDEFRIDRAVLVGLSMGGGTAVNFALKYPDSVRALVLVDSMLDGYRWTDAASNLYRAVIRRAREMGVEAARQLWLRDPMFEQITSRPELSQMLTRMVAGYSGWHWLYRDPLISANPPAATRLGEIAAPCLVVVGERDVADMHGIADAIHSGIAGSRKVVIPNAGHLSNLESPEAVNGAVLEFLRTL